MTMLSDIFVTRWGETGTRIVLVHGGVQGSKTPGTAHFSKQVKLVEKWYQLLIPDRPGHGRTAVPLRPDDAEADGEWLAEMLGDGAHLVGHSFGGCVALEAASRRPDAVKTLTLIEPGMQAVAIKRLPVLLFVFRMFSILKFSTSPERRIQGFSKFMCPVPQFHSRNCGFSTEEWSGVAMARTGRQKWSRLFGQLFLSDKWIATMF